MSKGETIDPLKASKIGFSFIFMRQERKLVKTYCDKGGSESYNLSIITDKSSRIIAIDIYKIIRTGSQGVKARRIQYATPSVTLEIQKDLQDITEE